MNILGQAFWGGFFGVLVGGLALVAIIALVSAADERRG